MSSTRVLLLLQTRDTLTRPFVLAEIYHALTNDIPVVPVVIAGRGYDYAVASELLGAADFPARLEKANR